MAENTIDSLQIDLSANVRSATNSIDKLIYSMEKLQTQVRGFSNINLGGFTNSMRAIRESMSGFSGVGNLTKGITQLQRLSRINFEGMTNAASGIREIASALRSMNGVSVPNLSGLDNLSQSIRKFGGKNISNAVQYLPSIANDLTSFIRSLNGIGGLQFDFSGVSSLVQSVSRLGGTKSTQAAANLLPIKNYLVEFITELNGIGALNFDVASLSQFVQAVSRLGSKSVTTAAGGNIKNLTSALSQMMTVLSNAPVANQQIIQLIQSIAQIASSGGAASSAIRNVSSGLTRYTQSAQASTSASKGLASAIGRVYATYFLLFRAFSGLGNAIKNSMDLQETFNYFSVAMDKIGKDAADSWEEAGYDSAQSYADSFENRSEELTQKMTGYIFDEEGNAEYIGGRNLGMDPNEVMQYQAMYAQMANSIGLTGETALNTSKALTMLGADWASLRNIETDEAWGKLASALAGETEAVRQLGVDVTEATLQQTAYKYGIDQTVGSMDRATKIQLTLLSVLDQSRIAWGDLAKTIQSPSNQLRVIQANITNLARAIGNIFLPVITKVLPYINAFIIALQRLFQWIGSLLGVETGSFSDSIGGADDAIGGFVDDIDDAASGLDDANTNAKKLKKTVLSFDELNQLNDNDINTSAGGGGGGGTGIGGSSQLDSAISDLLSEYEKVWNDAFNSMSVRSEELADKISSAFQKIYDKIEPLRIAFGNLWDAIKPFAKSVGRGLIEFLGDFGDLAINFGNYVVAPVLNDIADAIRKIDPDTAEDIGYALGIIGTALAGFKVASWIQNGLFGKKGLLVTTFSALATHPYIAIASGVAAVVFALDKFGYIDVDWDTWGDALSNLWSVLKKFVKGIGSGLVSFIETLLDVMSPALEGLINGAAKALEALFGALDMIPENVLEAIGEGVGKLAAAFITFKGISGVSRIISTVGTALGEFLGLSKTYALATIATDTASVAGGIGAFKGVSSSSGIIGKLSTALGGLLSVAAAHPLATVAAGLGAVAVSLVAINSSAAGSDALKEYAEGVDELSKSISESNEEIQSNLSEIEKSMSSIDTSDAAEDRFLEGLIGEYDELASKTNLTVFEKQRLRDITDELVEKIPDLSYYINEETGYLELQGDALDVLIKKQQLNYKVQAYEDLLVEAYKEQVAAEQALEKAEDERDQLWADYLEDTPIPQDVLDQFMNAKGDDYAKLVRQISQDYLNPAITGEELESKYGFYDMGSEDRGMSKLYTEVGMLSSAWRTLSQDVDSASETLDNANGKIETLTDELYYSQEAVSALDFSSLVANIGNTIDQAGGLWVKGLNGWKQISGEKALEIYQQIKEGLIPENGQGYYETGEGVMYAFGNGIGSAASGAVQTFDSAFLGELNKDLMEHGTMLMYQNGQLIVKNFGEGMSDVAPDLRETMSWLASESGQGFINGLYNTANSIRNSAVIAVAKNAVNAVSDYLEIGSPSKVFERIAEFCGQGFTKGIPYGMQGALNYFGQLPNLISLQMDKLNYTMNNIAQNGIKGFSDGLQKNDIAYQMQNIVSQIQNAFNQLYNIGRQAMIGFRNGLLSVDIPTPHLKINTHQMQFGNTTISLPSFDYDWYAEGGLVNGEIWGMNELGNPEMIGRVGRGSSRTAVANNAIISEAIEGAVERAMSRALMNNGQMNPEVTVYAELTTEDEVLARAVTRGQRKIDYRMNPVRNY